MKGIDAGSGILRYRSHRGQSTDIEKLKTILIDLDREFLQARRLLFGAQHRFLEERFLIVEGAESIKSVLVDEGLVLRVKAVFAAGARHLLEYSKDYADAVSQASVIFSHPWMCMSKEKAQISIVRNI